MVIELCVKVMVLKIRLDRSVQPVELRTGHQSSPKKTPITSQYWPKLVKNWNKPGTKGKSDFAPGTVFKTMVRAQS